MKYVVFLDVDGVFTSQRCQYGASCKESILWDKFDPVAVDFMNDLHDKYEIDFVLTSTWVENLNVSNKNVYQWVISAFRNAGFRGKFPLNKWKTNPDNDLEMRRGQGIRKFLEDNYYEDFLIFDDNSYDFSFENLKGRFVMTHHEDGLLTKHMRKAKSIVGMWDEKENTKT